MSRSTEARAQNAHVDWRQVRPRVTDELLQEMTQRIVQQCRPHKVILFGSYAKGVAHEDSDIDLLVIMDSDEPASKRTIPVADAAYVRFLPVDVLVYTPDEIRERLAIGDYFITDVLTHGKSLYDHDAA
jgi:uncharacterized protein